MSLTDNEILELNELCGALVDGTLTSAQKSRLTTWLAESEDARKFYVRAMSLSASLYEYAGEMQIEEPARIVRPAFWSWRMLVPLAAAAAVAVAALVTFSMNRGDEAAGPAPEEFVARLTGSKDCKWAGADPGDTLQKGEVVNLAEGFAEITFDCGAQIELTGPATLVVNSAWDAVLKRGTLRANVPKQAIGFRVSNPDVEVVDLGTEFSMVADEKGATEVFVIKGSVEAASTTAANREPIVLSEKESRRFAKGRVSPVNESGNKFAKLSKKPTFEQSAKPVSYVHWSFNESESGTAHAEASGAVGGSFDAVIETGAEVASASGDAGAHAIGRWGNALHFDGKLFAHAPMPNFSGGEARTVAFWVKVPDDTSAAPPPILSWSVRGKKKNSTPTVQIGWNRNPTQGAPGALRTDFGRGLAIGTTPFRDGRWHHVAIVFMSGKHSDTFTQAKQYVDGRLEQTTAHLEKKTKRRTLIPAEGEADEMAAKDLLWMGHRPNAANPKNEGDHFRGDLDELFITDRALVPREIVRLMTTNTLRQPGQPKMIAAE